MNARRALGVVALLAALVDASRAEADVVRLEDLEARAVDRRAALGAARSRAEAALAGADVARTAYLPSVALNVGGSVSPGSQLVEIQDENGKDFLVAGSRVLGQSGAFLPVGRYTAVVALQSRIYDFGRTGATVVAADARAAVARATHDALRADVIADVRVAYLEWLGSVALHALAVQTLHDARARVDLVTERIGSGMRPPSDLPLARYEMTLAELDESESRGHVDAARLEVQRAAATPLARDAEPDPSLFDRRAPSGGPTATPETVALEKQREAAVAVALADEHANSPILGATVEAGVRGQNDQVFPSYQAAVTLSIPLWDGNVTRARVAASRAEAAAVAAEDRERRAALQTDYERARSDAGNAAERLRIAEALRTAARERARDARDRYELGDGKLEPVLDAGAALSRAEREVLLTKIARVDAVLRLERWVKARDGRGQSRPTRP